MKTAKYSTNVLSLVIATLGIGFSACATADVFVIANTGTALNAGEIREVFLGEKQFAGAIKIVPVDNGAVQAEFLAKVLKMEADRYGSSWTKKSFRDGVNPPAIKSGDAEVLDFVKKTPGAVGYIGKSPGGVSIVQQY